MRTIIGVAIGTIAFWLAMLATAVAYILEHIFAIGVATALVIVAILASRLLDPRRRRRGARPPLHALSPAPRRSRKDAVTVGRLAGAHSAPTAYLRKVV
ncbi:hypothetical protein A5731_18500 [Mycolicibacterium conceptionense]|uniref:Uncharacterized protein n=1 Tax=Mycolicibacterium wolinskyi TaxID=59750 RepID=A0A1X2FBW2_9MYCO|nr:MULTISPECIES: hypothetical protein [Mycolicibacterium]MCV7283830.1 hypothetical protein [Mycolicibacterium wolinskyi]MCV7297264.1 hypothetical protein [Mycolicibacterium goodii]OBB05363.1 hypothetical protein A5718_22800 [Mycolicibacterium conceptionense]OBF01266.1 hypothetical protein A5731_18500 [Mycolicibacterium conceptionense]ORX15941.1 hypothetical protein AWC31_00745 [Mycolicibacterium wolinskyi]